MKSEWSKSVPRIPNETVRAASAVFGPGNFYILVGEHLEEILEGVVRFEQVILPPITFFQFLEGLTDFQAMDALRTRTDWKFALHLSLVSVTLHETELCRFRQKLLRDPGSQQDLQRLVDRLVTLSPSFGQVKALKGLDVVSSVCLFNRFHRARQTMRQTLEVLAVRFPQWLRMSALPHWYGRYNPTAPRLELAILLGQQKFLMEEIASDIHHLLEKIHHSGMPEMSELYEVRALEQIWTRQFGNPASAIGDRLGNLNSEECEICIYFETGRRR